ncbi:MAG: PH domain-containing protein [Rickettsiales bacterium]
MPTLAQIWKQIDALPHRYVFYTKKEIRYLPEILAEGENILALTSGYMNTSTWLCVCTNRRVLFLDRGMFFGLRQIQMNLDRIQSIDSSYTIFFGALRFWDGASSITIKMVLKSSIHPFVKTVQEAMDLYKRQMVYDLAASATNAHRTAQSSGSLNATADLTSELERLGKLREAGHLSEAEFQQAKSKLLQS